MWKEQSLVAWLEFAQVSTKRRQTEIFLKVFLINYCWVWRCLWDDGWLHRSNAQPLSNFIFRKLKSTHQILQRTFFALGWCWRVSRLMVGENGVWKLRDKLLILEWVWGCHGVAHTLFTFGLRGFHIWSWIGSGLAVIEMLLRAEERVGVMHTPNIFILDRWLYDFCRLVFIMDDFSWFPFMRLEDGGLRRRNGHIDAGRQWSSKAVGLREVARGLTFGRISTSGWLWLRDVGAIGR